MGNAVSASDQIVKNVEDVLPIMRAPGQGKTRKGLGLELEMFLADARTGFRLPYDAPKDEPSVSSVLKQMAKNDKRWQPYGEDGQIYGLKDTLKGGDKQNAADTFHVCLEPGGQIECAFPARSNLKDINHDIIAYMRGLNMAAQQVGAVPVAAGYSPIPSPKDLPSLVVPRSRYREMWQHLPRADGNPDPFAPLVPRSISDAKRNPCAQDMASNTSALQITIQAETKEQEGEFQRLGLSIMPVLTAFCNNSALRAGEPGKSESHRMENWNNYKPERSGNLPELHLAKDSTARFVEKVMDTPMMFRVENGLYVPANGETYRDRMKRGEATVDDFLNHMSSRADDIRIKREGVVELRQMDASPDPAINVGMAALVKGIFYNDSSRQQALNLVNDWEQSQRDGMRFSVPRHGFNTFTGASSKNAAGQHEGQNLRDIAYDLVDIAERGLPRAERPFLQPLKDILNNGNQAVRVRQSLGLPVSPTVAHKAVVIPQMEAMQLFKLRHPEEVMVAVPHVMPQMGGFRRMPPANPQMS